MSKKKIKLADLSRKDVRYWLYRFRNEDAGGIKASGAPVGLKKKFENNESFPGWKNFAVTWDVHQDMPMILVPRGKSMEQEWNEEIILTAKPMKGFEEEE